MIASERTKCGATHATSCVLKCPQGHDFASACAEAAGRRATSELRFGEIGPRLVEQTVHELGLERAVAEPEVFCPIDWFGYQRLEELSGAPVSERTSCVHLWNEMWRLTGREIPWPGQAGSVLGELSRM